MVLLLNRNFNLKKKPWNIFRNALLNSKLLAVHQWEKLFINSKLFSLQKNLTRVHLWGTFASQWRRVARVGYCGLSIKINAGIWLVGDTDTPWQWGVHWMETQFSAIFLLFKKGNHDIDAQWQSNLVHKYLFYMCTNFGWLIRVNAEAMLLWNQKTCS